MATFLSPQFGKVYGHVIMRAIVKRLGLILAVWICLALVGYVRYLPPAPQPTSVALSRFSAHRALPLLESLVGDGIPHAVGSKQNQVVRDRITAQLRKFGYEPIIQRVTLDDGTVVENILTRIGNPTTDSAIALVAHYDSVTEGPGASDNGVGVAAILEITRMLKSRKSTHNDVIFLLTDGEEYGLLGAEAFVNEHPWARDVRIVLNLDARGTSGPSMMFETSDENAWLIDLLAHSLTKPVTSSLFDEVYGHLPNYTDFRVFRDRGIEGFNFAFIRGIENYHSQNDNYEHVTPGSLQHHGDNVWQLINVLIDFNLNERRSGQAVYTDLFACIVLWWDQDIGRIWATAMPAILFVVALVQWRRARLQAWRLLLTLISCLVVFALMCALGWLVDSGFRGTGWFESPWSPWGLLPMVVYWIAMVGLFGILAALVLRKVDVWSCWVSVWGCWSLAGVASAWVFPASSYLFLLPLTGTLAVAVVTMSFFGNVLAHSTGVFASLIGAATAGCLWLPQQFLLYDALGMEVGVIFVFCIAGLLLTAMPLFGTCQK